MRTNILRAIAIILGVLGLMTACYAWENRDPNDAYWHEFSPA